MFHQERDRTASFPRAEILENPFARHHVKRRCFFICEGAQAAHARPTFLELNEFPDHLFNDGGLHNGVDSVLWNHAGEMRKGKLGIEIGPRTST